MKNRNLAVAVCAALVLPAASSFAGQPQTPLARAVASVPTENHHALVLVALGRDSASRLDDAIVLHSTSARYALRDASIVSLKEDSDDSYRLQNLQGECDGMDACAQDAFLDRSFTRSQVENMLGQTFHGGPLVTVFDQQGHVIGRADGFDDENQVLRFAESLRTATPAHPAVNWTRADLQEGNP